MNLILVCSHSLFLWLSEFPCSVQKYRSIFTDCQCQPQSDCRGNSVIWVVLLCRDICSGKCSSLAHQPQKHQNIPEVCFVRTNHRGMLRTLQTVFLLDSLHTKCSPLCEENSICWRLWYEFLSGGFPRSVLSLHLREVIDRKKEADSRSLFQSPV